MHKTGLEKRRISCSCKVHPLAQSLFPSCTPPFYGVYSHFITIPYSLSYVREGGNENRYYKQVQSRFYWCGYITNGHSRVQTACQTTKQHGSPWLCSIKPLNQSCGLEYTNSPTLTSDTYKISLVICLLHLAYLQKLLREHKRYTYIPVFLPVRNKRNEHVKLMAFNRSTYIQWNRLYLSYSYLHSTLLFYIPCQFIDKFLFQV